MITKRLTKKVDGIEYELSPAEDKRVRAEWAARAEIKRLKAEADALTQYQRDRAEAYPDIGDQLDAVLKHLNYMQMKGRMNLIGELDGIVGDWLKVKRDFPKPEVQDAPTK